MDPCIINVGINCFLRAETQLYPSHWVKEGPADCEGQCGYTHCHGPQVRRNPLHVQVGHPREQICPNAGKQVEKCDPDSPVGEGGEPLALNAGQNLVDEVYQGYQQDEL